MQQRQQNGVVHVHVLVVLVILVVLGVLAPVVQSRIQRRIQNGVEQRAQAKRVRHHFCIDDHQLSQQFQTQTAKGIVGFSRDGIDAKHQVLGHQTGCHLHQALDHFEGLYPLPQVRPGPLLHAGLFAPSFVGRGGVFETGAAAVVAFAAAVRAFQRTHDKHMQGSIEAELDVGWGVHGAAVRPQTGFAHRGVGVGQVRTQMQREQGLSVLLRLLVVLGGGV